TISRIGSPNLMDISPRRDFPSMRKFLFDISVTSMSDFIFWHVLQKLINCPDEANLIFLSTISSFTLQSRVYIILTLPQYIINTPDRQEKNRTADNRT